QPDEDGDKETRGRVLVAGGTVEVPGAVVLAGVAALRAGAGKRQRATCGSVSAAGGVEVPEARVIPLAETSAGGIAPRAAPVLAAAAASVNAFLLGPGFSTDLITAALVRATMRALCAVRSGASSGRDDDVPLPFVVIDAGGLADLMPLADVLRRLDGRLVLTPHGGEMATLLGVSRELVERDQLAAAREVSVALDAVVALKGARTVIAAPDGRALRYDGGSVGLATSGSGDTLAGIVVGLLARGAAPLTAAAWAAFLHGSAGNVLARSRGPLGFLARELLEEIPAVMARSSRRPSR
ncbi:MAG: NAD(P)H-hydrate dehydratase, partial [Gemmatimonadaceae bacterium]